MMFKFILKFIYSIIKTQRVRIGIVLCGMTICSFFVLGFFYFSSIGAVSKEEIINSYFYATYQYEDCEDIEEVMKILQDNAGITNIQLSVWMKGALNTAKPIDIPELTEEYLYTHREIIVAAYVPFMELNQDNIDAGRGFLKEENNKIVVTYSGEAVHHASSEPGQIVKLCGREYEVCGYYNNSWYDFLLPASELLDICRDTGAKLRIDYWYDDTFSYSDVLKMNEKLEAVKKSYYSKYDKPEIPMNWEFVFGDGKIIFISMIISVLNFMFVYQFILKNRIQQYRVLKLLGVTSGKVQMIIFTEMVIVYAISFALAYGILCMYIRYRNMLMYSMGLISLISFMLMLIIVTLIFVIFTRRFSKSTPFASYQEI